MTIKRIIRKKKKNEAGEALAKVSGAKELEMAATILRELAERENRKGKIEKLSKKRNESKKEAKHSDHDKKMKRLKEVPKTAPQNVTNALFVGSTAELQKMLKDK